MSESAREAAVAEAEVGEVWRAAHQRCLALASRKAALDFEIGVALLDVSRTAAHRYLGNATLVEYAERLFGWSPKVAIERVRVAEALQRLPILAAALRDGRLCFSAVRELTRVAKPHNEAEWLEAGFGRTVREIERLVSERRPGDRPSDPPDPQARRHVVHLEVEAETYALYRQAVGELRRIHGGDLDDEQALAMMARHALGGAGADSGRASHQIVMHVCERCGAGAAEGRGETFAVSEEAVERASCDAQIVAREGKATQEIAPAVRRRVLRRDHGRCRVPGCRAAVFLDIHHIRPRSEGGDHASTNLMTCCGAHHDAIHVGTLFVHGDADGSLSFTHADGSRYGAGTPPALATVLGEAFLGLRSLGVAAREARRVIDAVRPHVGADVTLAEVLRRCLAECTMSETRLRENE